MDNGKRTKRWSPKPLLVASAGLAMITMGACGGFTSGNLVAPRCDGGTPEPGCEMPDAGTDGGSDGGVDGGRDGN